MLQAAAAALVLSVGVCVGFAFARGKAAVVWTLGLVALAGIAVVVFVPTVSEVVQCRMGGAFWSKDSHPPEMVGAWIGWDTSYPTPCCRIELDADGTGRCAFWYERESTGVWRVTRWSVSGRSIDISVESGERREQMHGEVFDGALSLKYFGSDGPELTKNWFGPLHLVPERTDEEARQAIRRALEQR